MREFINNFKIFNSKKMQLFAIYFVKLITLTLMKQKLWMTRIVFMLSIFFPKDQ